MGSKAKRIFWGIIFFLVIASLLLVIFKFWLSNSSQQSQQRKDRVSQDDPSHVDNDTKKEPRKTTTNNDEIKNKDSSKSVDRVFERFELSESELQSFYKRRYEPRDVTLNISGLKIRKKYFQVQTAQELPETLKIPLPDGGEKEFTRNFVDFENENTFVWMGVATDDEMETLHLSIHHQAIVGQIETKEASYEIKYLSEDKNIIRKVDRRQYPENPNDAVRTEKGVTGVSKDVKDTTEVAKKDITHSRVIIIDIVVGYSYLIKNAEGGAKAAFALIKLHLAAANLVHRNSHTGIVINPKAIIELRVRASSSQGKELKRMRNAATKLRKSSTDPFDILLNRRHQTKSDLAALFTENFSDSCGLAYRLKKYVKSSAFRRYGVSVNAANCLSYVLAHEIGHNLGCGHNREDAGKSSNILPYAFGFRSEAKALRTVMSYRCSKVSCPRIPYFSDPTKKVRGIFLGQKNRIDNVRSIRQRAHVIRDIYKGTNTNVVKFPIITQQPQNGFVSSGGPSLQLRVKALSNKRLMYQWYINYKKIKGANQPVLNLNLSSYTGPSATYYVGVFNEGGWVRSRRVTVGFLRRPRITQQPKGGDVLEGRSLRLRVVASGTYLKYQWYRNGVPLKFKSRSSNALIVNLASGSGIVRYHVVVFNSPTSRVQSNTVKVRFLKKPRIIQQPKGGDVIEGGSPLKLTVVASGPYLKYQWYRNRVALKGQQSRSPTLTVNSASGSGIAHYHVVVFNSPMSRVQSNTVKVRFLKKPQIVREPENLYLGFNESGQFSIQVTGYPTPMVTWYKDGNVIPHETGLTLFFERAQWPHRGSYFAEASNSEGSVRTKEVYLHLTIINEGKWNILLSGRDPASLVEVGKIDRDMDVKNGGSTK